MARDTTASPLTLKEEAAIQRVAVESIEVLGSVAEAVRAFTFTATDSPHDPTDPATEVCVKDFVAYSGTARNMVPADLMERLYRIVVAEEERAAKEAERTAEPNVLGWIAEELRASLPAVDEGRGYRPVVETGVTLAPNGVEVTDLSETPAGIVLSLSDGSEWQVTAERVAA